MADDPLDFIDFADILQHGSPEKWKFLKPKPGSPVSAHSADAQAGTLKHYDIYRDDFGDEIEVHYFRHPDGSSATSRSGQEAKGRPHDRCFASRRADAY